MITVTLSKQALLSLIACAKKGYEELYKREVGGFLLGRIDGRMIHISKTVAYRTPNRSRSGWDPNVRNFEKKGISLETRSLNWIGAYHSHVEIGGSASTGQSTVDRASHLVSCRPLEVIVRVTENRKKCPRLCLTLADSDEDGGQYFFDVCGYWKDRYGRIRKVRMKSEPSAVPVT